MRGPRLEMPGGIYHVTSRGNRRAQIFDGPAEYLEFLKRLAQVAEESGWRLYAYTLMPNHVHLLIELSRANLGGGVQKLLSGYAVWHNLRVQQDGHVFQGRYHAPLCEKETYLLELVRYLPMNPVRAGLVSHPADWPWSSHSAYMGIRHEPWVAMEPILERFGPSGDVGRRERFERFVTERMSAQLGRALARTTRGAILGSEAFIEMVKARSGLPVRRMTREIESRPSLQTIAEDVAKAANVVSRDLTGRSQQDRSAIPRMAFVWLAVRCHGYRAAEVSRFLGRDQAVISRMLGRGSESFGEWRSLAEQVGQLSSVKL